MNTSQTVLLAGAGGVFGRHVTRVLTAAGHKVLGMGHSTRNEIVADLLDRDSVLRTLDGVHADVIVHAATALSKPPTTHKGLYLTDDLRVAGTQHLVEAASLIGARRFVGENIVFGYGYRDFGGRVLTESDEFGGDDPDRGFARHVAAMRAKEELPLAAGLDAISLRFGLFYGEGGTEPLVELIRRRRLPAFTDHGTGMPWVELGDAAAAVLAAIERGRPGEAYNIADESHLSISGMTRAIADAYRLPSPLNLPRSLVAAVPYLRRMTALGIRVDTGKALRELGWRPAYRTAGDGLRALANVTS